MLVFLIILLEIAGILMLGEFMGVALTLLWIIFSFFLGLAIMRYEGFNYMRRMMEHEPEKPNERLEAMVEDGMMPVFAGFLLVLPGPFTDLLGLLLIVPIVRKGLIYFLNRKTYDHFHGKEQHQKRIIEGEFWRRKK